jgi:PhnB protein
MASNVKPIPEGYRTLTPYLNLKDADKFIEFAKKAFGAEQRGGVMTMPDGKIGHAEIHIGDSVLMLSEAGQMNPATRSALHLYVNDVDAFVARAEKGGAKVEQPPTNMFWGDRFAKLSDAFGTTWSVATHIEDVAPQEMGKRMEAAMNQMGKK